MASNLEFSSRTRQSNLERLKSESYDVLVVGGGITGAGIARDAALRGFKTALVERHDFASGTSSKSARMIHSGLRYLESFQFGIVYQSCKEKRELHKIAPGLVITVPFTFPIYNKKSRYYFVWLGLWVYEVIALFQNAHIHEILSAKKLQELEPAVSQDGLVGVARYYDALGDDARITLANVISAHTHGATVANYAEVIALLKTNEGQVAGACVRDLLTGNTFEVKARVVVSATGPWNDSINLMDRDDLRLRVRPNKGIHVVVPRQELGINNAVAFMDRVGKRAMYALPWGDTAIVGTTDGDYRGSLDAVYATGDEVRWVLDGINGTFVHNRLTAENIISTYAGIRPLVEQAGVSAYRTSRDHKVSVSNSGLVSITGGKFTTYRIMARDVIDRVAVLLNGQGDGAKSVSKCRTRLPVDAGITCDRDAEELHLRAQAICDDTNPQVLAHLVRAYGSASLRILERAQRDPTLKRRIDPNLPYIYAEIPHAVQEEMTLSLSDMMMRRMHWIHEEKQQGLAHAEAIAGIMGIYLGWSETETARQVEAYRAAVALTKRFLTE